MAFLDERSHDFYADWERAANDTVAILMADSAAPDSPSQEALDLLVVWAATADREQAASSHPELGG